jgi:hypothetical protein
MDSRGPGDCGTGLMDKAEELNVGFVGESSLGLPCDALLGGKVDVGRAKARA